jgi:glycerol kinase
MADSTNNATVLAIDAGTTGVRTRAVFADGRPSISSYREFTQHFPRPGWVEHDAGEIWLAVEATLADVASRVDGTVASIGITNQRETVVAWDRRTGVPVAKAIVWQDRRTARRCEELAPHLPTVRRTTGLVLDPYFSGTKAAWLLENCEVPPVEHLAIGTVDAWLVWKLTGGSVFATDPSNASRTMLFDIRSMRWSGDIMRSIDGAYSFVEVDGGTQVFYEIEIELVIPLPGFVKRRAEQRILDTVKELKTRAES